MKSFLVIEEKGNAQSLFYHHVSSRKILCVDWRRSSKNPDSWLKQTGEIRVFWYDLYGYDEVLTDLKPIRKMLEKYGG